MSNAFTLIGLNYDSTDLQTADFQRHIEIVSGFWEPPEVRGEDPILPYVAGRWAMDRINDIIRVRLKGYIQPDPTLTDATDQIESFQMNMRDLRTLFRTNRTEAVLQATVKSGLMKEIEARPLNLIAKEIIGGLCAEVDIELLGYDDWMDVS